MKTVLYYFNVILVVFAGWWMSKSFGFEVTVCILLAAILANIQHLNFNSKE